MAVGGASAFAMAAKPRPRRTDSFVPVAASDDGDLAGIGRDDVLVGFCG